MIKIDDIQQTQHSPHESRLMNCDKVSTPKSDRVLLDKEQEIIRQVHHKHHGQDDQQTQLFRLAKTSNRLICSVHDLFAQSLNQMHPEGQTSEREQCTQVLNSPQKIIEMTFGYDEKHFLIQVKTDEAESHGSDCDSSRLVKPIFLKVKSVDEE
jgi:hypothetical protein